MKEVSGWAGVVCLAVLTLSCTEVEGHTYTVNVRVTTDTGEPVAGAVLRVDGAAKGISDGTGNHEFRLDAARGQRRSLSVSCPSAYREHAGPVTFALREVIGADGLPSRGARIATECVPRKRRGVLVVRARGGVSLPVLVDGKRVAVTSAAGVAHVAMELIAGSELRVAVDTSASPDLIPANPTQRFVAEDRDSLLAFDVTLHEKPPRRPRRRKTEDRPYRMN